MSCVPVSKVDKKKEREKKRRQKFSNREKSSKPPKHVCVCPWTFTNNNNALDYWRRINRRPFRFDEDEDETNKSEYEYREGGGGVGFLSFFVRVICVRRRFD